MRDPVMLATLNSEVAVKTATGNIAPHELTVHVDSTGGALTLTAPSASEALRGVIYTVRHFVDNGNVTLAFPGSTENPSDQVHTQVHDFTSFYTDGIYWYILAELTT